jgi:hypothetical protein
MPRLNWNFAVRHQWSGQWTAAWVIAISACVHAVFWRAHLLQERDGAIAQLNEPATRQVHSTHPAPADAPAELKHVFSEMRAPWIDMMDSLQRVTHPGVELISLEPESNAVSHIRINGMAGHTQDVFDLVEALQKDPSWSSIQLVSQASTNGRNTVGLSNSEIPALPGLMPSGISFSLVAQWKEP